MLFQIKKQATNSMCAYLGMEPMEYGCKLTADASFKIALIELNPGLYPARLS